MSTSTSAASSSELTVNESGFPGGTGATSYDQVTAAETYDMSTATRKIVYLSLLAGVLLLGGVAAYVWYGFYLWQNIP